ncbi:MAG: 3-oxoacyl-ACP reductase FabG [Saprospiraceae bacterium]|nr:3-oxoacyl-ACP reductase FabG [Saprospiraceae bacterium]
MKKLEGKVAIITGGAQGIGEATAIKFINEGATVAIWDISEDKGKALAEKLDPSGQACVFSQVNTTDLEAVEKAAKQVFDQFGKIDILINNAGITRDATMKKITIEQWDQVIDVNLKGVFFCTKAVAPYMVEAGYGRIVNASSVVGIQGNFGQTNYVATKAGVIGMTKVWSREFGRKGITVNAIAPGFISTEMMNTIPDKILDVFKGKSPLNRLGEVEEVANAYCFLASDEASFITGTVLSVDGGVSV